jgi:arsenate reductase
MTDTPPRLIVYEKPSCSTCRRVVALLTERGIDFDRVNYMVNPLSVPQLRSLLDKSGLRPRDALRLKEPGARELPLQDDELLLAVLAAHPELLQRPIVVSGNRAVLARPPEKVLELLA